MCGGIAAEGVTTGRIPGVADGASEPPEPEPEPVPELAGDGGVKSGGVSASGASAGDVGVSGTEKQNTKAC